MSKQRTSKWLYSKNHQWAVTTYGLECLTEYYVVPKRSLDLSLPAHSLPQHMADKGWVNMPDLALHWLVALSRHGYTKKVKRSDLQNALDQVNLGHLLNQFKEFV